MGTAPPEQPADQTETQRLFDETWSFAERDLPELEFFGELLPRLLRSFAGVAGAVWLCRPQGIQPACLAGWERTGLEGNSAATERHAQLLQWCRTEKREFALAPTADANGEPCANLTGWLLYLAPIRQGQNVLGILEIFQHSETVSEAQRVQLSFMKKYSTVAAGFLAQKRLTDAAAIEARWQEWEQFSTEINLELDLKYAAMAIANESRRLAACDRCSVVVRRGSKLRLLGTSGLEEIDNRAATVTALERLARAVCKTGEPLYVDGTGSEVPSAVDRELEECLELTNAKTVVVVPLLRPLIASTEESERRSRQFEPPVGAIILEQMFENVPAHQIVARLGPTPRHATLSLAHAIEHERIFLLPVWRTLGRGIAWLQVHPIAKITAILGGVSLLFATLFFFPVELEVEGKGTLQPSKRREVFAEVDGEITAVRVHHDDQVDTGQVLVVLRNVEIELKLVSLEGERSSTRERILGIESLLLSKRDAKETSKSEQLRLHGERAGLHTTLANLERQVDLLNSKKRLLEVSSPMSGRILTWNAKETLLYRPVKRGDSLLTVADIVGDWELQVRLPEDRTGFLTEAQHRINDPLVVRFLAANQPHKSFEGRLREVHNRAESSQEGNTVLLSVDIDRSQIVDFRPGAQVTARVQCGTRPLGYVLLHDVWAFLQKNVLFRWL